MSDWDEAALRDSLGGEPYDVLTEALEQAVAPIHERTTARLDADDGRQNQDDQAIIEAIVLLQRHNASMA